jgi:hypothetical protein
MKPIEYWKECLSCAADDISLKLTEEQLEYLADAVQGGHENYGMAYYQPENPLIRELRDTEKALKEEREKVSCKSCNGSGRIVTHGPHHSSDTQCWKCNGEGKVKP